MGTESPVRVGTTASGDCLVQVVGRATMQHSPSAEELVVQSLQRDPTVHVAVDLSGCTYLDSTFLGCLFGLHRRFVQRADASGSPRLRFHAPPDKMKALFGPLRLDRVMGADPAPPPAAAGPTVPLAESPADRKDVCRHVAECHRRLAEADTPARAAFAKIAESMERELAQ